MDLILLEDAWFSESIPHTCTWCDRTIPANERFWYAHLQETCGRQTGTLIYRGPAVRYWYVCTECASVGPPLDKVIP